MLSSYIYAINATGDLLWYRHLGRDDGSFQWEGPKKVGSGWDGYEHVFSGGGGIIYVIEPRVEATLPTGIGPGMGGHPASGGNLLWYRHVGQEDGSFRWEGPVKVGTGWGGFQRVFSGGKGIIYAVTPIVEASLPTGIGPGMGGHPASGGDLMWYRHLGQEDGTFRWEGPKKVGNGWGDLEKVVSDGDVIYAVTPLVAATLPIGIGPGMGGHPASGGDLMWYRHLGQQDGSFKWEGPKKVGTGWSGFEKLFAGGDGILYLVEPVVEPSVHIQGRTPPQSGGDLRWYRHVGQQDGSFKWEGPKKVGTGWSGLEEVFSAGRQAVGNVSRVRTCGIADPASNSGIHVTTFGAPGGRWGHGQLTFKTDATGTGLTPADQKVIASVINNAFQQWDAVSRFFSFSETKGDADFNVQFGGQTLDSHFGGAPGGVTGVGYYPEDGRIFIDSSEGWDTTLASQQLLLSTMLHEIGHALGLAHSTSSTSIMYPYGPSIPIDAESIEAINGLYSWQSQQPLRDRGSVEGPSLAIAGAASLAGDETKLYMAWRGVHGDDRIYWSVLQGDQFSPQRPINGIGSLHGPALASYNRTRPDGTPVTGLFMAWDGVDGDDALYFAQNDEPEFNEWPDQASIPGAGTSARPALAMFNGQMYAAWKGVPGDSTIYWSRQEGSSWMPPQGIAGRGTSDGPALTAFGDRLYMFWKGIEGDTDAYFAWLGSASDAIWQVQTKIFYTAAAAEGEVAVNIGTSGQPSATVLGDEIVLAWKGVPGDTHLFFSRFRNGEWSGQTPLSSVGTASGPGVAAVNGRLYLAWRGIPGDTGLYYSWL
jgi:hypothetical protein